MELLKTKTQINFLGMRHVLITVSFLVLAMTFYLWVSQGDTKYGVDFKGGTELIVKFNEAVSAEDVRKAFSNVGLNEVAVQQFQGQNQFSIKLAQDQSGEAEKEKLKQILQSVKPSGFELLKEDFVGPIIGEQIRKDALLALIFSLVAMLTYVAFRFDWRFGVGAIVALFHDVIFTLGFCLLAHKELSAGLLAALLTIVGYSMNDTVIVFDRVRENLTKARKNKSANKQKEDTKFYIDIMNLSINETLSRTILTSMTAFLVVTTLWLFGGGAVADLNFALMVGILVGTYSSIFIACPFVLACCKTDK
ncbi:MAG: protein translocase subunit SecF [Proteobacteria bacterium]|nr:protein translocase subunit SecF [Pseudomonadota bacterium]